jgi:lysophospholipase L1-like esterase
MTAIRISIGAIKDPDPNKPAGSQIFSSSPGLTQNGNIYGSTNALPFAEYMVAAQAIPTYRTGSIVWKITPSTIVGFQTDGTTRSVANQWQPWSAYVFIGGDVLYSGTFQDVKNHVTVPTISIYVKLERSSDHVYFYWRRNITDAWALLRQVPVAQKEQLFPCVATTKGNTAELIAFDVGGLNTAAPAKPIYTLQSNPGPIFKVDGNSMSTGFYDAPGWFNQMIPTWAALGIFPSISSNAVDGHTTRKRINVASRSLGIVDRTKNNFLFFWEGTNDVLDYGNNNNPNRVALAEQNIREYCRLRQLEGWRVILMTTPPRANGYIVGPATPAQYDADCRALDALLVQNSSQYAEYLFNFRQQLPGYTPTLPLSNDGVHPSTAGGQQIGGAMRVFLDEAVKREWRIFE